MTRDDAHMQSPDWLAGARDRAEALARSLFDAAEGPPYADLLAGLSRAIALADEFAALASAAGLIELSTAAIDLGVLARGHAARPALDDDHALALAEAMDRLTAAISATITAAQAGDAKDSPEHVAGATVEPIVEPIAEPISMPIAEPLPTALESVLELDTLTGMSQALSAGPRADVPPEPPAEDAQEPAVEHPAAAGVDPPVAPTNPSTGEPLTSPIQLDTERADAHRAEIAPEIAPEIAVEIATEVAAEAAPQSQAASVEFAAPEIDTPTAAPGAVIGSQEDQGPATDIASPPPDHAASEPQPVHVADVAAESPCTPEPAPASEPAPDPAPAAVGTPGRSLGEAIGPEALDAATEHPLSLPPAQSDLLSYLMADLRAIAASLPEVAQRFETDPLTALAEVDRLAQELARPAEFFGLPTVAGVAGVLADIARQAALAGGRPKPVFMPLLNDLGVVLAGQAAALERGVIAEWSLEVPRARLAAGVDYTAGPAPDRAPSTISSGQGTGSGPAAPESLDPAAPSERAADAAPADSGPAELTPEQVRAMLAAEQQAATWGTTPLALEPERAEQLQFAVGEIKELIEQVGTQAPLLANIASRGEVGQELVRLAQAMSRSMRAFQFRSLDVLLELLGHAGAGAPDVPETLVPELIIRVRGIHALILQHVSALEVGMETTWPLDTLRRRLHRVLAGAGLAPVLMGWHNSDPDRLLELDGVVEGIEPAPTAAEGDEPVAWSPGQRADPAQGAASNAGVDTLRVESRVVDQLLDTIGELVQHKGRLQALVDEIRRAVQAPGVEELARTAELMDRSIASLQSGVMGTRVQPASRLLERYPRVVRDVSRMADKEVAVAIEGGSTLVDKVLLDQLADPITAILRYAATRLIEAPQERVRLGKPPQATIRLRASNQGSRVVFTIEEDGTGFDRDSTLRRLLAAGLLDQTQAQAMPDGELHAMLFDPRLTTCPLSAAGEAVRLRMGGTIAVRSEPGRGSRIDLAIPMKSAILTAVIVEVGRSVYCIPLRGIVEITRLDPSQERSVGGGRCIRLREQLLPLIDARELFGDQADRPATTALVITDGQTSAALAVDRVINKQDIAIRHLENPELRVGPFSGTSITQAGRVSLVVDAARVLADLARTRPAVAEHAPPQPAAA